ncbi:YncE family protein [Fodinibius halophilus]|uniref:YncE family protein n=1 Tax=Fodinibius halophilus TaxID=1736908 RepID=A0A6M1T6F4_9BACT|nr:DUF5074 domain-containing protein [Fodinibius halophilus]NGP86844.1 hypothetical protein [Fodinibius halophilus]
MKQRYSILLLSLVLVIASCGKDNGNNTDPLEDATVYVLNEGNFSSANGSITSYSPESGSTTLQAFDKANGRPMAGYLQTSKVIGDRLYIVSNKANKIEIVDKNSLKSEGTIEFTYSPTAIEVVDETAYVGLYQYNQNSEDIRRIIAYDLANMKKTDQKTDVSSMVRDIEFAGGKLYATNNGGNTVTVLDPSDISIEKTINVGYAPNEMLLDNEDRIWIACNGSSYTDKPASLYVLDAQTATKIDSIVTGVEVGTTSYQKRMSLNVEKAEAYLINDGISVIDMNTYSIKEQAIDTESFYSIGYFPLQERIYTGKSKGTSQAGKGYVYDLKGTAVDSFNVGIIPHKFHFTSN